jgi:cob(I)alamin adenosyltransferase
VRAFGNFVMKQMGRGFVKVGGAETDPEDIKLVAEAWAEAEAAIRSGQWDLIILDEINYAIAGISTRKVVAALEEAGAVHHLDRTQRASDNRRAGRYRHRDANG